jgi:hypothetical protein
MINTLMRNKQKYHLKIKGNILTKNMYTQQNKIFAKLTIIFCFPIRLCCFETFFETY